MQILPCVVFLLLTFCFDSSLCSSAFRGCNVLFPKDSCFATYVPLKNGLLSEYRNIYELQRAFYPIGKFASHTLINVRYNIIFTDEVFSSKNESDTCPGVDDRSAMNIYNGSTELSFLTGWTSSVVFNVMSPIQLTKLQLQLSNFIFSLYTIPGSGIYRDNYFSWTLTLEDNLGDPVRLESANIMNLTINISEIACIPDLQLIKSSLLDITAMLQVWASTEGLIPEQIDKSLLGYVTEPGVLADAGVLPLVQFHPFFSIVCTMLSFTIGLSSIVVLGTAMPIIDLKIGKDREQFYLYYFAISLSSFLVCVCFIVADFVQMSNWCSESYFDYFSSTPVTGCDGVVITKAVYYCIAILLSLTTSIIITRYYTIISLEAKTLTNKYTDRTRIAFVISTWFVLLAFSFGAWSLVPTLLQVFVYPSVVLTLTLVMWAMIFWFTVIFTIPLLLYRNIKHKSKCTTNLYYLTPFLAMVILVFIFILVTIAYLDAVILGSQIGDVIGIIIAAVPSIGLTFFTEFYRDWFLTRTVNTDDMEGDEEQQQGGMELTRMPSAPDMVTRKGSSSDATIGIPPGIGGNLPSKKSVISLRRSSTGLVSNGEPPGFWQRKLHNLSTIRNI